MGHASGVSSASRQTELECHIVSSGSPWTKLRTQAANRSSYNNDHESQ